MMIDQTASFADLLRRFRVAAGLTQETLADEAGLSARGISDLERGARRAPYAETVRRIADSLRLTASERAELLAARARPDATTDVQPSAQRRLHNLPPPLTSFVGRQREVAELHKVLRSTRLLTLTGAGGVGKTRLALELAANMLGIYADGVWLVELASVSDASLVPQGVAAVLGIREQPGRSYLAKLSDQLQSKHLLLVLDNCEQVLEACAELTNRLLQSSPHVAFLTTSREPLRVRGEVSWPVPALSISVSPGQALDDNGKASEAAQLFVERARAVRPDFALTAENAAAVADLCRRLDGLPLAIELAAARTRAVPVRALVQMLTSASGGLPILTDGPRGVPERQRTLRSTIAWSYDLLSADEQALFRRLGVCRGAGLETIQSVCIAANDGPGATSIALPALHLNALNGVSSLVSKSLVRLEGDDETEPRYVMLETVREFALERLEASGEGPAVRRRHALHFLRFVEDIEPRLHDSDRTRLVSRLEREHANWRSALDWCVGQGYAEPSLRLGIGLATFWLLAGHVAEGRAQLTRLLSRFPIRGATGRRAVLHAWAQHAAGRFATLQGELTVGRRLLEEAFAIMQEHAHNQGIGTVLESLAFAANQQADFDTARAYLEQRVALGHTLGDPWMITNSLYTLGCLALEQGELFQARALLQEAISRFEQLGDPHLDPQVGYMYIALAKVEDEYGQHEHAQRMSERALSLMQRGDDPLGVADALATLGGAAAAQREFASAYDYLASALLILQQEGDVLGMASVLDRFALCAAAQDEHARALRLMGAASAMLERAGMPLPERARSKLEAKLASARHALGAMAETAVAAGRALPRASAIAEALAVRPQALAGSGVDRAFPLTAREVGVAALIAQGKTNRQIATDLVITEGTVANHVAHILAKLDVRSRAQIAVWASAHALRPPNNEAE